MFNLFKKKENATEAAEATVNTTTVKPKKRKKELMRSVLKESVVDSVIDDMLQNERFVFMDEGEKVAVGLLLDTADIGGLSKQTSRDEAKGSIIEQINGGEIKTLITADMMEKEQIIFIPEPITLNDMSEYELLTSAPYKLAYIHRSGEIEQTEHAIDFQSVLDYLESEQSIEEFLSQFDDSFMSEPELEPEPEVSEETEETEEVNDGAPFTNQTETETTEGYDEMSANFDPNYMDKSDYDENEVPDMHIADVDDKDAETTSAETVKKEDQDEVEVPEEAVVKEIKRVFYSDDLDLQVSSNAFDVQFMDDQTFRPFVENRGEGWMNNYLAVLSEEANGELDTLHKQNLREMREMYIRLLTEYCEKLRKEFEYENPETAYGKQYEDAHHILEEHKKNIYTEADNQRVALNKAYDEERQKVGDAASQRAQMDYDNLHQSQLTTSLSQVEPMLNQKYEDEFKTFLKTFHEARRHDAATKLDYGITETLAKVTEEYKKRLSEENQIYREHRNNLVSFIKENRENDVAHDTVLAKELSQSEKAEKVMQEMTAKIDAQATEFKAKRDSLLADIEDMKRNRDSDMERLKADYQSSLDALQKELDKSHTEYRELTDKFGNLDAQKNKEYQAKLNKADVEKSELTAMVMASDRRNRKIGVLMASIATIAVIAALLVGYIFGMHNGQKTSMESMRSQIEQQVNERVKLAQK